MDDLQSILIVLGITVVLIMVLIVWFQRRVVRRLSLRRRFALTLVIWLTLLYLMIALVTYTSARIQTQSCTLQHPWAWGEALLWPVELLRGHGFPHCT